MTLGHLAPTVLAASWAEFTIATMLFLMRLWVNGMITRRFKWDFWWSAITWVLGCFAQVFLTVSVYYGLGSHIGNLTPYEVSKNQFYEWMFTTFAIASICTGKLAVIAFICQIEGLSAKSVRKWILYSIGGITVIVNITIIPIIWTQCTPTVKIWNNDIPGDCSGRTTNEYFGYFQGSLSAVVDFALALYPMIVFWNLQLRLHVKVGLCVLFGFGIVASVCACVKTYELSALVATNDLTYVLATLDIWAVSEMWIVLIVSCIPAVRPLFASFLKKVYISQHSRSYTAAHKYPTNNGYINQDASANSNSQVNSRAYAYQMNSRTGESKLGGMTVTSNESEEDILREERDGGIMLTRKVSIHYEASNPPSDKLEDAESGYKRSF